jgi:hypothetical protein
MTGAERLARVGSTAGGQNRPGAQRRAAAQRCPGGPEGLVREELACERSLGAMPLAFANRFRVQGLWHKSYRTEASLANPASLGVGTPAWAPGP